MAIINQPIKDEVNFYSVFSLLIRRKFIRKTIAGIITNEINKTLNIIVQFIPIIKIPILYDFVFFYEVT